jgi:hypothetical protein
LRAKATDNSNFESATVKASALGRVKLGFTPAVIRPFTFPLFISPINLLTAWLLP